MKTFILYILLLCCAVLTACEHKDLCYNHPHDKELRIRFDWSAIDKKHIPNVVKVICSPLWMDEKNKYLEFDLPPEGGIVRVPDGEYELMAYNNDSPVNQVVQQHLSIPDLYDYRVWRFILTTPNSRLLPNDKMAPDFFCLAVNKEKLRTAAREREIVMRPLRRTAHVNCTVKGIETRERSGKIYGVLTGCSDYMDLASGICLERLLRSNKSSVLFEMEADGSVLQGNFNLLRGGFAPGSPSLAGHRHLLEIYVLQKNGKFRRFEGDVTKQVPCDNPIGTAMPDFDIYLEFTIPPPATEGGGESMFDPDVDDWDDVETVLPLAVGPAFCRTHLAKAMIHNLRTIPA